MNKEQVLKQAIDYQIAVAEWVKAVFKWHKETADSSVESTDGPGSNPPPPPPPPPGLEP